LIYAFQALECINQHIPSTEMHQSTHSKHWNVLREEKE
jgi:hypothetical protein